MGLISESVLGPGLSLVGSQPRRIMGRSEGDWRGPGSAVVPDAHCLGAEDGEFPALGERLCLATSV